MEINERRVNSGRPLFTKGLPSYVCTMGFKLGSDLWFNIGFLLGLEIGIESGLVLVLGLVLDSGLILREG